MASSIVASPRKTVLLTAGRSPVCLDLARQLNQAGCRVLVADTMAKHVCGASRAVSQNFVVRSPALDTSGFIQDVKSIARAQAVDTIVPIYEEGLLLASDAELQTHLFAPDFAMQHNLHNKWTFVGLQKACGLVPPPTQRLDTPADLAQLDSGGEYALKACYSRASQQLYHQKPGAPLPALQIDADNPWIAQTWITGKHYCSYSVCEAGRVRAHTTYPVTYTVDGHSCVYFEAVAHPEIEAWVQHFVGFHKLRGQVAFDFIESPKGGLYAIECNPRPTSGVHLFAPDGGLGRALLAESEQAPLRPVGIKRQLMAGMLMFAWRQIWTKPGKWFAYVKALLTTRDALLAKSDPWPFFQQRVVAKALRRLWGTFRLPLPSLFLHEYQWDHRPYLRAQTIHSSPEQTVTVPKVESLPACAEAA